MNDDALVVCLGYPALFGDAFVERTRAVDPRIEVVTLPVDEGTRWLTEPNEHPNDEPPPWATGCADARREALARAEVLVHLHAPSELMRLAPRLRCIFFTMSPDIGMPDS